MTSSEFDRQLHRYLEAGFGEAPGFADSVERVRAAFDRSRAGDLPPTLVIRADLVGAERPVAAIDRDDGRPETVIHAEDLMQYGVRDGLEIPEASAYVLSGVCKEPDTRNVRPADAVAEFARDGRSPLTIEEGLAIWRLHDGAIARNDGLSLAASTRGDKRVPAVWISKNRPKLGWCFFGVPHTWLATASCRARLS